MKPERIVKSVQTAIVLELVDEIVEIARKALILWIQRRRARKERRKRAEAVEAQA